MEILPSIALYTGIDFARSILESKMEIGDPYVIDMFKRLQPAPATKETKVCPVVATVSEIVLSREAASFEDICEKSLKRSWQLCMPNFGPSLRLQYLDQREGDQMIIGMEPIVCSDQEPRIFLLECRNKKLRIRSECGCKKYFWPGFKKFVFILPSSGPN